MATSSFNKSFRITKEECEKHFSDFNEENSIDIREKSKNNKIKLNDINLNDLKKIIKT